MSTKDFSFPGRQPQGLAGQQGWQSDEVDTLIAQLHQIRSAMLQLEADFADHLHHIPSVRKASARNLLHYIALRCRDIRTLQLELVGRGLSSLGRCESHVISSVESVLSVLQQVAGKEVDLLTRAQKPVSLSSGRRLMEQNTRQLLGGQTGYSGPVIMVTMPSAAAEDYTLVRDLVAAGMGAMRINCAHDDEAAWGSMIDHLHRATADLGRECRVAMDLGGPKIRTGQMKPGPRVVRWHPHRDAYGRVTEPARIWISFAGQPDSTGMPNQGPADAVLQAAGETWHQVGPGDVLYFADAGGRQRKITITRRTEFGLWAESRQTTYVTPDTVLSPVDGHERACSSDASHRFGEIASKEPFLVLRKGDRLILTGPETPGCPASYDAHGKLLHHATIGCTLPEIFPDVRQGQRILFNDGKIGGTVVSAGRHRLVVEIAHAKQQGTKLRADKGINLPDTDLQLPALTAKDRQDLAFITRHADMVNYSFVRRPMDLENLYDALERVQGQGLGVVLKIENRQAFEQLPMLLLTAMQRDAPSGVMIARGDLAVECGWERMAELQEEILWMCEAAHMPVIWATQVLEGLAKKGLPSRAEITDAAMGARAECVMLNKGPNIVDTVCSLRDILSRMQEHQVKKRPMFRRLEVVDNLLGLLRDTER